MTKKELKEQIEKEEIEAIENQVSKAINLNSKQPDLISIQKVQDIVDSKNQIEEKIKTIYFQLKELTNQFGNMFLERVMAIGSLLIDHKESIGHGNFESWVNDNLPFNARQARKYMGVYKSVKQNGIENADLTAIKNIETLYKAVKLGTVESVNKKERNEYMTTINKILSGQKVDSKSRKQALVWYEWKIGKSKLNLEKQKEIIKKKEEILERLKKTV